VDAGPAGWRLPCCFAWRLARLRLRRPGDEWAASLRSSPTRSPGCVRLPDPDLRLAVAGAVGGRYEDAVGAAVDGRHALVAVDAQRLGVVAVLPALDERGLAQQRSSHGDELEAVA